METVPCKGDEKNGPLKGQRGGRGARNAKIKGPGEIRRFVSIT